MKRKHVITGWTSKRSRLAKLFKWRQAEVVLLWAGNDEIYKAKGKKSDWCVADWPPKRVKITVEIV